MLLNELIADKLEQIRQQKGIGVYTLCNKAAMSYNTYRGIRQSKNKDIFLRTLLILLKTLDYPIAQFFADPRFASESLDIDFK